METTIRLGRHHLPRIGLGTNRLAGTPENLEFIKTAVQSGTGMIDTAHLYTGGESERTIGRALKGMAGGCFVATKGGFGGGAAATLRAEIEQSLQSLATDTIDLYYLHRVDTAVPIEESIAAIKEYQDAGKIAHIGVSEVDVSQIERARRVAPIAAVQNHYNVGERKYDEVVDYCTGQGIVFVPFYPLKVLDIEEVSAVARQQGCTAAQVALAWLLARSPVMFPIPGTLSVNHLRENLAALNMELSRDEFELIARAGR